MLASKLVCKPVTIKWQQNKKSVESSVAATKSKLTKMKCEND